MARKRAKAKQELAEVAEQGGLSPNPMTNLLITDLLLRGGGRLLKNVVERTVLGASFTPAKAKKIVKGRSMTQTLVGTALARVATRSVPGAIVVGGGVLAKALYERRRKGASAKKGEEQASEQAEKGETA
ncbi:hypothetical protein OKA06_02030 [Novosphingobium sp. MW5]|nr:hypothetical protein [Novosphingobium sp. MW5]